MEHIYDQATEGDTDEQKQRRQLAAQCDVVIAGFIGGEHSQSASLRRICLILG